MHPFHHLKVGLVVTELPGLKDSVTEKTIAATEERVTQLTGTLLPPVRTPHEEAPIGKALEGLISQGADLLLVVGASAVVDRRDVGPAGIVAGRRRDPAFRHAGGSRQPDLPRPHRHPRRPWCCPAAPAARS